MKKWLFGFLLIFALVLCATVMADTDIETPLTFEAKDDVVTFHVLSPKAGMKYRKEGGDILACTLDAIPLDKGQKVQFYGNGTAIQSNYETRFSVTGGKCYIYGNIMSLVDEIGFATAKSLKEGEAFRELFMDNPCLINHGTHKLILPATILTDHCYESMFKNCTSLTTAPDLPSETLAASCYADMFKGCTSLTAAPDLPALTLKESCYSLMFEECTSLTAPPDLPAETMETGCCEGMFKGCTSLTTAPVLKAPTLAKHCYKEMFSGCTSLDNVVCLATDISAEDATTDWLFGVASSGTFTKVKGMENWSLNNRSGIPADWTVQVPVEKYSYISGDGSTWTKSSVLSLFFRVENSEDDKEILRKFTGIRVDGRPVPTEYYTASPGSVKIELKPAFLETLSVGEHKLTAEFTDGTSGARFTVTAGTVSPESLPQTGDGNSVFVHLFAGLLAIAGLGLMMKKRS